MAKTPRKAAKPASSHPASNVPTTSKQNQSEIYISAKSVLQVTLEKAVETLASFPSPLQDTATGKDTLTIHGLGTTIFKAIQVALQLQQQVDVPCVITGVTTDSVVVYDDVVMDNEADLDADLTVGERFSSACHIAIQRL